MSDLDRTADTDERREVADNTRLGIDLAAVVHSVVRRRFLLVLGAVGGLALGVAWAVLGSKTYEVRILATPVDAESSFAGSIEQSGIASLVGLATPNSVTRKDETVATLTSRAFLYSFIRDLNLMPVLFGQPRESSWKASLGLERPPTLNEAYQVLLNDVLDINEQRSTGLLEITVRWSDPETPAVWAQSLIARLNKEMQEKARARAEQEVGFLKAELARTDIAEVRQAIFRLIEARLQTMMLANVAEDYALRIIDPPIAPEIFDPVSLSSRARIVLGVLFGLFGAVALALLLDVGKIVRLPADSRG